jgi:hypothetical protein
MPNVQHKRGTRSALDALATANGLLPGQIYIITDESRIAVALSVNTYETYAKQSEAGGGGGSQEVFVQQTRPAGNGPWTWWKTNAAGAIIDCVVANGVA